MARSMVVKVASKLRQATSRLFSTSNVVGEGMLVRLRSTTIGILGLVAAVGLGLVGIASQQGWPGVLSGPLPKAPARLVENDPIAMPRAKVRVTARPPAASPHGSAGAKTPPPPAAAPGVDAPVRAPVPAPAHHPHAAGPGRRSDPSPPQGSPPDSTTVAQVPAEGPPAAEDSPVPAAAKPEAGAPGHSGESHGHAGEAHGPPGMAHANPPRGTPAPNGAPPAGHGKEQPPSAHGNPPKGGH